MDALVPGSVAAIRPSVFLAPLGVWVAMAIVAIINGGLREIALIPRVGDYRGHVISTAVLVVAICVIAAAYFWWTATAYSTAELVAVGIGWTLLTVGFEFVVGYVEGTPVAVTLGQYNVFAGQVWITVPVTLLCAPLVFGSLFAQ
jgi:hypothetical protein